MRKQTIMIAAGLALTTSAAHANLVINGSFEDPQITSGFIAYFQGSTAITGWTVTAPTSGQGVDIVSATQFVNPGWAFHGEQSVELAGTPGRGGVEQPIPTTPGEAYLLSFVLSSQPSIPVVDGVSVFWDGTLVDTLTSPGFGTWQTFSYTVLGGPGSTSQLAFVGNVDGFLGTLVDDVSVVVIPAPSGLALFAGFSLLASRPRR